MCSLPMLRTRIDSGWGATAVSRLPASQLDERVPPQFVQVHASWMEYLTLSALPGSSYASHSRGPSGLTQVTRNLMLKSTSCVIWSLRKSVPLVSFWGTSAPPRRIAMIESDEQL